MRIIFMGTPDFAVPSLEILLKNNYNIVGVITSTDKMGGRGKKKVLESAVKKFAKEKNLNILQPKNLKAPDFIEQLKSLNADLQIVVAFRMLPEIVWKMPKYGTINLHGSLLPKYRGAAPINWAVIKGEKETGVTTFLLQHKIDTGDLLFQEKIKIGENETTGDIHDKMMMLGANVVLKTVKAIEKNDFITHKQNNSKATKAPKIFHKDCKIDFNQTTLNVHNFIRGLSPYPTAWTILHEKKLKIFRTEKEITNHSLPIGYFKTNNKNFLKYATKDGFVSIKELQWEGRKRMQIKDFLNGVKFPDLPKIGVTGGIGSGKTTVCKIFETLGIPVYYADDEAKRLMVSNPELIAQIKNLLGNEAYLDNNKLNKIYVAEKIFSDKNLLQKMNAIVHPALYSDYLLWHQNQHDVPYTLFEAAILFESKHFGDFNKTITIFAPENMRIKRVTENRKISKQDALNRIKNQLPEEKRQALADFVIINDEKTGLIHQVLKINEKLKDYA